jgi:hypothetical protein
VTVPTEDRPPVTFEGLSVTEAKTGGRTRRGALTAPPLKDAEIVTAVEVETGAVVTANVALLAPSGMVTDAATLATAGSLLDRETATPLAGAGPLNVTTPVDELPPVTLVGLKLNEDKDREEPEEEVGMPRLKKMSPFLVGMTCDQTA